MTRKRISLKTPAPLQLHQRMRAHLVRIVAVGQDVQQVGCGHKVEARECTPLRLHVVCERLLAHLQRRLLAFQELEQAVAVAAGNTVLGGLELLR